VAFLHRPEVIEAILREIPRADELPMMVMNSFSASRFINAEEKKIIAVNGMIDFRPFLSWSVPGLDEAPRGFFHLDNLEDFVICSESGVPLTRVVVCAQEVNDRQLRILLQLLASAAAASFSEATLDLSFNFITLASWDVLRSLLSIFNRVDVSFTRVDDAPEFVDHLKALPEWQLSRLIWMPKHVADMPDMWMPTFAGRPDIIKNVWKAHEGQLDI